VFIAPDGSPYDAAHPETWLESGREDAEGSPLRRLRRGWLAAWTLRIGPGRSTGR
jgi:hypothetical protein